MSLAPAPDDSPVAADLADLEAIIERGLDAFVEVGNALLAIKIDKKYRAAGYSTFEDYCQRRWNIARAHGYRLVTAAATVQALAESMSEMSPMGDIRPAPVAPLPTSERQVRPLTPLPEPERVQAWTKAVETAGGGQPTARQVEDAVADVRAAAREVIDTAEAELIEELDRRGIPTLSPAEAAAQKPAIECMAELWGAVDEVLAHRKRFGADMTIATLDGYRLRDDLAADLRAAVTYLTTITTEATA